MSFSLKFYQPEKEPVRHKGARDLSSLKAFITNTLKSTDEEDIAHKEGLFDLTSDNFESHIETSPHFIMFYAPWCGHCKRLEPIWAELAKMHQPSDENPNDVKIGKVIFYDLILGSILDKLQVCSVKVWKTAICGTKCAIVDYNFYKAKL